MNSDILTEAIVKLFEKERFYAELVLGMDRILSERVLVAGVRISKTNIELVINPVRFAELPINERVAVLKHECQHILNDHIPRSKELAPHVYEKRKRDNIEEAIDKMKHQGINIACDLAINPGIKDTPDWTVNPQQFDLPEGRTMEWYFQELKTNEKAKDFMEFDDHSLWGESEGDQDILREKIKKHVNTAAQKAGTLSSDDQYLISKLNQSKKDWRAELKRFVANQIESTIETSRKKRNRRYGVTQPGYIKVETMTLGVAIDTSGSVSDQALEQFMAEIGNIAKYANVIVVEADSEVKNSYVYNPKKQYTISGRGGTAYQPAFDYFNDNHEIDGLIYFGDMDTFDTEEIRKPKYPVLWAIIGEQDPPVNWGGKTQVKV